MSGLVPAGPLILRIITIAGFGLFFPAFAEWLCPIGTDAQLSNAVIEKKKRIRKSNTNPGGADVLWSTVAESDSGGY